MYNFQLISIIWLITREHSERSIFFFTFFSIKYFFSKSFFLGLRIFWNAFWSLQAKSKKNPIIWLFYGHFSHYFKKFERPYLKNRAKYETTPLCRTLVSIACYFLIAIFFVICWSLYAKLVRACIISILFINCYLFDC